MMVSVTQIMSLCLALASVGSLVACDGAPGDPDEQLRAWIDEMHEAAEAKQRGDIIDRISPAYADARGNSRDDIENMLRAYFLRSNKIVLLSNIDEIKLIAGTAAEVSVTVGMAGTNNSALGLGADAYRFELELTANGDDWQLIAARWGELGRKLR